MSVCDCSHVTGSGPHASWCLKMRQDEGANDVESFEITFQRSELIPGGNGARIAYCDDFPDRQFLILPTPKSCGPEADR